MLKIAYIKVPDDAEEMDIEFKFDDDSLGWVPLGTIEPRSLFRKELHKVAYAIIDYNSEVELLNAGS